jgi:hypothetical protein
MTRFSVIAAKSRLTQELFEIYVTTFSLSLSSPNFIVDSSSSSSTSSTGSSSSSSRSGDSSSERNLFNDAFSIIQTIQSRTKE